MTIRIDVAAPGVNVEKVYFQLLSVSRDGSELMNLDAATGASSHVTRALDSGPRGLVTDLRDRVTISWERMANRPEIAVVAAIGFVALVGLTLHVIRSDQGLEGAHFPFERELSRQRSQSAG